MKTVILQENNIVILETLSLDNVLIAFKESKVVGMITRLNDGWCLKRPEREASMFLQDRNELIKTLMEADYVIKTV